MCSGAELKPSLSGSRASLSLSHKSCVTGQLLTLRLLVPGTVNGLYGSTHILRDSGLEYGAWDPC